jgi:ankyrin repeat protein
MINSLKIYAIYSISTNDKEIDYNEIPDDLHEFIKDFIKFFKLKTNNLNDFIHNFNKEKNELLRYAAIHGHLEIIKYLIEHGTNIHANNDVALRFAAANGYLEVVKYLHQNGADIATDDNLALIWAAENGHREVVKYLKSKMN